jgi:hypothetical protein
MQKKSAKEPIIHEAQWSSLSTIKILNEKDKKFQIYAHFFPMKNKEHLKVTKWK